MAVRLRLKVILLTQSVWVLYPSACGKQSVLLTMRRVRPQGLRRIVESSVPKIDELARAKIVLVRLWQARQFHEAARLSAMAMARWPHEVEFRGHRAKSLLAAGALPEAEAAAREALETGNSDAQKQEAWIVLADALIRQERAADARETLREACLAMPGSVALQARRGHQAAQAKDFAEAIDAYQMACDLAPEREALQNSLLSVLWQTKRYAVGSKMAARAIEVAPQAPGLRLHLANFLLAENRAIEAAAAAREAIELDPTNTRAHWVLVDALWRQDRYNESFRTLEAAIERFPTDVFLLQQMVRLAPAVFREDTIVMTYRRAIGLAEMPRSIWEVLIRALIKQEEFEEAAHTARRAMLLYPTTPEFSALLAEILLRIGTGLEAITQDIADVLGQESRALPVQIALISGLLSQQKWDEAASLLEELRADTADQPELMLGFGIALTGKGAHDDAVAILSALAEKQPDNLQTWEALCDAHREAKHIKGAIAAYRRLEALGAPLHMMRRVQIKLFGEQVT